jgi:hypothetical protein
MGQTGELAAALAQHEVRTWDVSQGPMTSLVIMVEASSATAARIESRTQCTVYYAGRLTNAKREGGERFTLFIVVIWLAHTRKSRGKL